MNESDFVNFWCIYIISLAHEQFIKNPRYSEFFGGCKDEIRKFKETCAAARIPEIEAKLTLREVLAWTLASLRAMSPKLKYTPPGEAGEFELTLFGPSKTSTKTDREVADEVALPKYVDALRENLSAILRKCNLHIWFMIDKLDEIFPRRSAVERLALRGLLRVMRIFSSPQIRIKVFFRDDMLNEVVGGNEGFVALTHLTARKADLLKWSEEQIISMIAKRVFSSPALVEFLDIDREKLEASLEYRRECLYKVLPQKVYPGARQSTTLRWLYQHTADGNGVVTPRDIIILLTAAIQHQINIISGNESGESQFILSPQAIIYGHQQLSLAKRRDYLQAEFPHFWPHIEKLIGGKAEYSESDLKELLGNNWSNIASDLSSIGLLTKNVSGHGLLFKVPFIYREGLEITQGRMK